MIQQQETVVPTPKQNEEILQLNQRLLDAIATADWTTYEALCDPQLTAFEPEARGQRVQGLGFHRFYFDLGAAGIWSGMIGGTLMQTLILMWVTFRTNWNREVEEAMKGLNKWEDKTPLLSE